MISKKIIQNQNYENLLEVSHLIKNIEYFIFYGTLFNHLGNRFFTIEDIF